MGRTTWFIAVWAQAAPNFLTDEKHLVHTQLYSVGTAWQHVQGSLVALAIGGVSSTYVTAFVLRTIYDE